MSGVCEVILNPFSNLLVGLNHSFDDTNLYNKIAETTSIKNKKVKIVLTKNRYGKKINKFNNANR